MKKLKTRNYANKIEINIICGQRKKKTKYEKLLL